ncbi:transcriptional regulator [Fervidicella metallireducens AeB]|uniref:Stage 0 sporulation protein A homolog n=1 Tax=Fervidicella metallireducens AeB TaxID=1403537 RepID=A0A017RXA3_9CLOT|nr:transcriptional regulator [Fervidicella metallireducens AeB]
MKFFLVDDDDAIRSMLTEIIEDCGLGEVVGEAQNGAEINSKLLNIKKVDILIIDLLMPIRDGLETVREVAPTFDGKIIMLSQIEDKKMVGEAYSLGVEYYITKPINRLEVIGVVQKVIEHMRLQKSINDIQNTLNFLTTGKTENREVITSKDKDIISAGQTILTDLGIIGESGSKDLLEILKFLSEMEGEKLKEHEFPSLKDIFLSVAEKRLGTFASDDDIKKEIKASEQRVRRAIYQA